MKPTFTFFLLLLASSVLWAQDSLRLRDVQEIKLLAQRKVERGLADLLNTVTFEDLSEFERKSLMADSYGESPNKLFYNAEVIVEDDINPEHTGQGRPLDLTIDRYLNNLELFYKKSADATIKLSDFRFSNVKKTDHYYIKVFYKSHFGGQHNQIAKPYIPVERVAEVRAEKKGKKWVVYIARLAFFSEKDSLNATLNDVAIAPENTALVASTDNTTTAVDEAEAAREKERETERKAREEYNRWLSEGEKALADGDYEKALEAFTEAEKRNDYDDLLPRRKIFQVKRAFEKAKQTQVELLKEYLFKASVAQKNRQYTEAIGYLRKALEIKPDSAALGQSIQQLNNKARIKAELDEKYNAGQYADLIKDYTRNIDKDKTNSDYYLGRGMAYVKTNRLDRAMTDFNEAIKLDFANLAALEARSELYLLKKDRDVPKAIGDLTSYLNIDPKNTDVLIKRANLRIQTRNAKGAFEDYDQAIELSPKNPTYYYLRGYLASLNELADKAIADFTQAIKLNSKYNEAYYERGLVYTKALKLKEAGADFAQLRQLDPSDDQLAQIKRIADQYFDKGFKAYNLKRYKEAIAGFDESILIQPSIAETWYYRGVCYTMLPDSRNAIESFSAAVKYRPDYSEAFYERGKAYFMLKQYPAAADDYRQAHTILPTYYMAIIGEGDALFEQKMYDRAITLYENIKLNERKITPPLKDSLYAAVYDKLGWSYYQTKQVAKSLENLDRAIDKRPDFSDAYLHRGKAQEASQNLKRAIGDYRKAIEFDNQNPFKYALLAESLQADEKYDEAIKTFTQVIDFDESNECCQAKALIDRGECYYIRAKYEEASNDYITALGLDETLQTSLNFRNTGFALLFTKKAKEALEYLPKALDDGNLAAEVLYGIACAHLQLKNPTEALKWFEKAFQTGQITTSYLKKDKLLPLSDKAFEKTPEFKALTNKLSKR
ncbi:MAG: tetratricopeptide repeat protein [Runella sp.]